MMAPGYQVLSGDGGFPFNPQELETATHVGPSYVYNTMRDNSYDTDAFQEQRNSDSNLGITLGYYDIAQCASAFGANDCRVRDGRDIVGRWVVHPQAPGTTGSSEHGATG